MVDRSGKHPKAVSGVHLRVGCRPCALPHFRGYSIIQSIHNTRAITRAKLDEQNILALCDNAISVGYRVDIRAVVNALDNGQSNLTA